MLTSKVNSVSRGTPQKLKMNFQFRNKKRRNVRVTTNASPLKYVTYQYTR
ncbi:hypothetical protein RUMCAL_02444 [Ruminococcus callidus ATCC 27760]|uniref:Uncharacterized protein n=1 Tax=Ruminococcus callidus ATCC 27760 TaxID=411473 RepID=U2KIX7_9FIRM|nr:hypothetical protein RUMCAL_02444 [Ruminococcus callidus ATCC 27760]